MRARYCATISWDVVRCCSNAERISATLASTTEKGRVVVCAATGTEARNGNRRSERVIREGKGSRKSADVRDVLLWRDEGSRTLLETMRNVIGRCIGVALALSLAGPAAAQNPGAI